MDDAASVTTSCLAISDKRPRRTGGCVGVFFQLFDWNRRFAKKKLFSKRLLPPDRAKQASKKLSGDDILLIGNENIGSFPNKNNNGVSGGGNNGDQTPSLVARLMGLESMPSIQSNKLVKDSTGDFRGGRRQKLVGENIELDKKPIMKDIRPQKLQKTGMVDRKTVTRFGAEALQLKNVLSRSKKHHHHHHPKLVVPVQNNNRQSKRNTSRLIGAATRVLESGLQARNKSKYAITYSARNRMKGENLEISSQQASCKNCGSLIEISESNSKREVDPFVLKSSFDQKQVSKVNCLPINGETKDFVALNRNLTGQTRSRVAGKVEDAKFVKRVQVENGSLQWQKRKLTRNRTRTVNNAKSAGKQLGLEAWKPDYQGQIGNKSSDEMAFRFTSSTKNRCETVTRLERRKRTASLKTCSSKPSVEKFCVKKSFTLKGDCLGALVEEKLQELTSRVGYDSRINRNQPKRTPATNFQDLFCSLSVERQITGSNMNFSKKRNHVYHHSRRTYDHNTRFRLQAKLQPAVGFIRSKSSDHLSPGSFLEANFLNESCCSSSLEDSTTRTQHGDSMTYSYEESQFQESETNPFYSGVLFRKENTHNKLAVDLLTYISQVLSTIDVVHSRITGNMRAHIKQVIFNSELVLSNQMPRNPNEVNSFFICDLLLELDTLEGVIRSKFVNFLGSQNAVDGYQMKRFVFDVVIEYLESKYARYSKCGFRTWINLALFMGFDVLIQEIVEEVNRWTGFVGVISDELVEGDMSHCLLQWSDFETEVYETGAKIESDILQMLVDEIVFDI